MTVNKIQSHEQIEEVAISREKSATSLVPHLGSVPNRTLPKILGKYGSIALLVQNLSCICRNRQDTMRTERI
jgi:hypothetical protein